MRHVFARRLWVLLVGCCLVACGEPPGAPGADGDDRQVSPAASQPARVMPEGHQRMLALLRDIADRTDDENPVLGNAFARGLRATLPDTPPAYSDPTFDRYFNDLNALAAEELRLGDTQRGVELYELAHRLIREKPYTPSADAPAALSRDPRAYSTAFYLAVAYLRLGEVTNCVHGHSSESCILPIRGGGVHVHQQSARQAIGVLETLLDELPGNTSLGIAGRWLLNIAYMAVGEYPQGVPRRFLIGEGYFTSAIDFPRFDDVAGLLGVDTFDLCGGAICEDFDNDGDIDILTSTWDTRGQIRLYRNNGDGTFTDATDEAGLTGIYGGLNMTNADYDNDGDADVLVLRGAWLGAAGRHPNSLLRNDGNLQFTDVTFDAGLGDAHFPSQSAAWADYDNDGHIDVYISNEHSPAIDAPNQLFRNNGDGTFTDVAAEAAVRNERWTKGVAWGDYDDDRWPDLYVSNFNDDNRLYRNNGDGTFTDVAVELGVTGPRSSFPVWFWDFNQDGKLDLMVNSYMLPVGTASPDMWYAVASDFGLQHPADVPALYKNDGEGGFVDVAREQGVAVVTLPMGANFGDLNNDGYPDYYLGTGYPGYEALLPNRMYLNNRGERFVDVTYAGGFGHVQKGHGVSFADLDNDGDQDVFEQIGGFFPADGFHNALFENPGFGNHFLMVSLVGVTSNRAGIGARIAATIDEDGRTRNVYHTVGTGGSFGGNPLRQHLGVGRASRITTLEVYWPTSDTTQRFDNVAADQWIVITEGAADYIKRELRPTRFAK